MVSVCAIEDVSSVVSGLGFWRLGRGEEGVDISFFSLRFGGWVGETVRKDALERVERVSCRGWIRRVFSFSVA